MSRKLDKLTIRGFKSIERLEDFPLGDMNVLIGANGSGKSNFVEFFRVLRAMMKKQLQAYMLKNGPGDHYFFNGVAYTRAIEASVTFGLNRYSFELAAGTGGRIYINREGTEYKPYGKPPMGHTSSEESGVPDRRDNAGMTGGKHGIDWYIWNAITSWQVYHFHDTSSTAGMRRDSGLLQSEALLPDASNLAAFMLHLYNRHRNVYDVLVKTIQRVAPYFDDFSLYITPNTVEDQIRLTWRRKGSDYLFSPGHLSDGTIRFICLATVLTQPNPPATIVLDEPELGLHPEAIAILGGLLRSASKRMQIIVATQSPALLSEFEPGDVITVDQKDGASQFKRLEAKALESWLDDFSLGELWQKGNVPGGIQDA